MPPAALQASADEFAGDPPARRRARSRIYGLSSFMEPGNPMDFPHAFGDNVRRLLRECAALEERRTAGMPTWCTLLFDERSAAVLPLFTLEEFVPCSPRPFCDYCRCTGWSHHLVATRRYHFIIPADKSWDKPLDPDAMNLQNHLLHGLFHCDGFGHLIWINGRDGGSTRIPGRDLMSLWDRLCNSLRARQVTLEDVSRKRSLELRLLYGVAYGTTWFGRWGYEFCIGSYGITRDAYRRAIELLSHCDLDSLIADAARFGSDPRGDLRRTITFYRKLHRSDSAAARRLPILTARDLVLYLLDLKRRSPTPPPPPTPTPPKPRLLPALTPAGGGMKRKRCRDFAEVAPELESRWPVKRLRVAAQVIVDTLKENGGMTRQEVREAARLIIGDTGLLDFVLKSLGNCVVGGHIVRRAPNPATRVLEFSIDTDPDDTACMDDGIWCSSSSLALVPAEVKEEAEGGGSWPSAGRLERDTALVYRRLREGHPDAAVTVLDSKHWVKTWGLRDEEDELLRFQCMWMPSEAEMEVLTRQLAPPVVVVVVEPYAAVGELRKEAERRMRDTYCILEWFRVVELKGLGVEDDESEPVFGCGVESGSVVWVKGEGAEMGSELRYEGGADTWAVGCVCGARDDDGERMVACDACDVWHHTRCIGIGDGEAVPKLFLCPACGSSIVEAAAVDTTNISLLPP